MTRSSRRRRRVRKRNGYEPGTPSWVDLSTPDPEDAKRFYGGLFGWDAVDPGPPEETGGYAMFQLRGKQIAGIGPLMSAEQPAIWSTYVATDDADAVVARATDAGGMVIVEPMDVMDAGRMAFVMHPAAARSACGRPTATPAPSSSTSPGRWRGTSCTRATWRAPRRSTARCSGGRRPTSAA